MGEVYEMIMNQACNSFATVIEKNNGFKIKEIKV